MAIQHGITGTELQYREINSAFRQSIINELETRNYQNVSRTDCTTVWNGEIKEYAVRFNILAKPPCTRKNGARSLDSGHNEIDFIMLAPMNNPNNYREGLNLSMGRGIRIVFGEDLVKREWLTEIIEDETRRYISELSDLLHKGEYYKFTQKILFIVNSTVEQYKTG